MDHNSMMLFHGYASVLLRACLVILFPFSGLDKILNWNSALKQAGNLPAKPVLLVIAIAIEFAAPIFIVTEWHDRIAAFILAGFCVVTAVLFHQFWRFPNFWRFKEGPGLHHFWDFLKNMGLAGGLGFIALASSTMPIG